MRYMGFLLLQTRSEPHSPILYCVEPYMCRWRSTPRHRLCQECGPAPGRATIGRRTPGGCVAPSAASPLAAPHTSPRRSRAPQPLSRRREPVIDDRKGDLHLLAAPRSRTTARTGDTTADRQNSAKCCSRVFGCIGTYFCKKIRVLQHFSKSTRLSNCNF